MSLNPVRLFVRGLTLVLVGAAVLLLSGVAQQPVLRPVAVTPNDPVYLISHMNLRALHPGAIDAIDAWDDEWHFVANGDVFDATGVRKDVNNVEHGYVSAVNGVGGENAGPLLVRFGHDDMWMYKLQSGDFICGEAGFGSIPYGMETVRNCEVAQYWVNAVKEGEQIPVRDGATWVRYGWGTNWGYAKLSQPTTCDLGLVGGPENDPARYVNKICQIQSRPWGGVVATEGQTYTIPAAVPGSPQPTDGGAAVRYGVDTRWVYKLVPAGTTFKCGVAFFGQPDPAYMANKHCEVVPTMGAGVRIAVINQGHLPHPDLEEKLLYGVNTKDFTHTVDDCPLSSPLRGRGVMVAGIAAATTFNKVGIAGVAPMARIEQMKDSSACNTSWGYEPFANAIRWAAGLPVPQQAINQDPANVIILKNQDPAKVIILKDVMELEHCNVQVAAAIAAARLAGSILVVPAGDTGTRVPIDICPGVTVVAGIDLSGDRVTSSNFGAAVDLAAPGEGVAALGFDRNGSPGYAHVTTTSAAAAQYGGVAALMFGRNPALSRDNVSFRLQLSSRSFPRGCDGCGIGMLDANRAMRSAEAITTETEDNDDYDKANYISASADVKGSLVPKQGWGSLCTVSQPCCKNATEPSCPQPKQVPDQDWFTLMLPPNQTLRAWIQNPAQCATDCYFDVRPVGGGGVAQTYAFGAAARYSNTGTTHQAVNIRIHSQNKAVLADYQLNVMWRDERRYDGNWQLGPVERPELR